MNEEITKTTANKLGKAFDSIIDPLHQRISNPFIASFLISWVIFNWKTIVFLIFSSQSIENKFEFISHSFYGNEWYGTKNILLYFIFPLVISFLYLLLLPRLENIFDDLNKGPKIKKSDSIKDINLKILENRKAYAQTQAEIENIRADYLKVQGLNQNIEALNAELDLRNTTIEKNESQIRSQSNELEELNLTLERIKTENDKLKNESENLRDSVGNYGVFKSEVEEIIRTLAQLVPFNSRIVLKKIIDKVDTLNDLKEDQKYLIKDAIAIGDSQRHHLMKKYELLIIGELRNKDKEFIESTITLFWGDDLNIRENQNSTFFVFKSDLTLKENKIENFIHLIDPNLKIELLDNIIEPISLYNL